MPKKPPPESASAKPKRRLPPIPTVEMGVISTGYTSAAIKHLTDKQLEAVIKSQIKWGPQIITLPVPDQRHAFFIDIKPTQIEVYDWNGRGAFDSKQTKWHTYKTFLKMLKTTYDADLEFKEVDPTIMVNAQKKTEDFKGGGCAEYIYEWLKSSPYRHTYYVGR